MKSIQPLNNSPTTFKSSTFFEKVSRDSFLDNKSKPFFPSNSIQPKLTIGAVDDPYEREADAMADKVMRMPDKINNQNSFFRPSTNFIQRKCDHCEEEEKKLQRKEITGSNATVAPSMENYIGSLSGGRALNKNERSFFEPRMGYDFSNVRLHTDDAAHQSAKNINALAYTHANNIVFGSGQYQPNNDAGKKLLAHELTHVVQQNNNLQTKKIQRIPETWFRGEGTGVAPAGPGGVVHDFGDGLYLADTSEVAARYAAMRAASQQGSTELLLNATFERSALGRVLDLTTDSRWQSFLAERPIPNGVTNEALIRMANENYSEIFQLFVRRNGINLGEFDTIIGPEFVRGGNQLCIRNPAIISQIRGILRPYVPPVPATGTAGTPATEPATGEPAPATVRVSTRFNILDVTSQGGNTVAEVEVLMGEGADQLSHLGGTSAPVPSRIVLRITTNGQGALVGAESVGVQLSAEATEALARQILSTLPQVAEGAEAASAGAAAGASRAAGWARGVGWAGAILFIGVTAYQYSQAQTGREKGRVLVTAGAGLAGAAGGTYLVCNLAFGIESFGLSLFFCGLIAGGAAGYVTSSAAGAIYDEATATPEEKAVHDLENGPEAIRRLFYGMIDSNGNFNGVPLTGEFIRRFMETVPGTLTLYEAAALIANLRATGAGDNLDSVITALSAAILQLPDRRPVRLPDALNVTDIISNPGGIPSLRYQLDVTGGEGIGVGPVRLLPPLQQPLRGLEDLPPDRRPAQMRPLLEIRL